MQPVLKLITACGLSSSKNAADLSAALSYRRVSLPHRHPAVAKQPPQVLAPVLPCGSGNSLCEEFERVLDKTSRAAARSAFLNRTGNYMSS
jgi:hypothetical protein